MSISDVTLSELRDEDSKILFEWINNKELVEFNSSFSPVKWEDHCRWFDNIRKSDSTKIFGIRMDGVLIGSCQLLHINTLVGSAELQIRLGYFAKMGKGHGSSAIRLLIEHGFNSMNLQRIYLHVFSDNERAIRAYLKNGFVKEGLLRRAAFVGDVYKDVYIMAVLKGDLSK